MIDEAKKMLEDKEALDKAKRIDQERQNGLQEVLDRYEDPRVFGKFLLRLRKKYGWTRKFVASKLGFSSESSVMNFERGLTVMRSPYQARFCAITPDELTVPILYSMFDSDSVNPPCRCPCHQDFNNSIPKIYDDEGRCRLCNHAMEDGSFSNSGHWFENQNKVDKE